MAALASMLLDREGAPEPSLLPYLARWIVPDALGDLVYAADQFGNNGGIAPPWFPLYEATLEVAMTRGGRVRDDLEHDVRSLVLDMELGSRGEVDPDRVAALLDRLPPLTDTAGINLRGLLAPALEPVLLEEVLRDGALDDLRAEPARRLLVAAGARIGSVDAAVVRRIVAGADSFEIPFARRGHLAPAVSDDLRTELATEVARELADVLGARSDWYIALVLSRLGPYAPREAWRLDLFALEEPWAEFVDWLLRQPASEDRNGDVMRAHPLWRELAPIDGLHESSVEALHGLDRWRGAMAMANGGTEEESGAEPPGEPGAPVDRRMQVDVYVGDAMVERAFVADADHEVVFSIGRGGATIAGPAVIEPDFDARGVERVTLTVRFSCGDTLQEEVIKLPKDQAKNSETCTFRLRPAATARNVVALIAVYDGAVVLAAASLVGGVVADVATERSHHGRIDLLETHVRELLGPSAPEIAGSITTDGSNLIGASAEGSVAVDVSALATKMAPVWERIEAFSKQGFAADEAELRSLLRDLAPFGQGLRSLLVDPLPAPLRGDGPLQVVATSAAAVLPLELVYDRHDATATSEMCGGWRSSLSTGTCDTCPHRGERDAEPGATGSVCPMRFWGLRRVIEHHTGGSGGSGAFGVRSGGADADAAGASPLPPLQGAVVAASASVADADVEGVVAAASAAFGHASRARTWKEWGELVTSERPAVLVLMPHQAQEERVSPPTPALEIDNDLLLQGALTPAMVRAEGAQAPVVLLLGCNTAGDELPVTTFAGEFRNNGAGFVVSTLVEVVIDEAPRAARAIIAALAARDGARPATAGEALLRARRELVAEGLVMSLALVGHGDPTRVLERAG